MKLIIINKLYVVLFLFVYLTNLTAQECNFKASKELMEFKKEFNLQKSNTANRSAKVLNQIIRIPLVVRVHKDSNTRSYTEATFLQQLQEVNNLYKSANIEFYSAEISTYDGAEPIFPEYKGRVIKINANISRSAGLCGIAFNSTNVEIYCGGVYILAHELGHALGLVHTHIRGLGIGELVDGSNCATAGDGFCDTPADPNLSGKVTSGCVYRGTDRDANGDLYQPDVTNIMSYTPATCATTFSNEQKDFMYAFAQNFDYSYCDLEFSAFPNDQITCKGSDVTLSATPNTGTVKWYDSEEGGILLGTGNSYTVAGVSRKTKIYLSIDYQGCELLRRPVTIDITPSEIPLVYKVEDVKGPKVLLTDLYEIGATTYVYSIDDSGLYTYDKTSKNIELLSSFEGNVRGLFFINNSLYVSTLLNQSGGGRTQNVYKQLSGSNFIKIDSWPNLNKAQVIKNSTDLLVFTTDRGANTTTILKLEPNDNFIELKKVKSGSPDPVVFKDKIYFKAQRTINDTSDNRNELWVTDATAIGTILLKETQPNSPDAIRDGANFVVLHNELFFVSNKELWKTDGTSTGTRNAFEGEITNFSGISDFSLQVAGESLLFMDLNQASNEEITYISDGTFRGTRTLFRGGNQFMSPLNVTKFNSNTFLFSAFTANFGFELWKYNTDTNKAEMVKDIVFGNRSSNPSNFKVIESLAYFIVNSDIYVTDASEAGTFKVGDSNATFFNIPLITPLDNGKTLISFGEKTELISNEISAVCKGETTEISIFNIQGNSVKWYDQAINGNLLFEGITYKTGSIFDDTNFYVAYEKNGCESVRTEVQVRTSNCTTLSTTDFNNPKTSIKVFPNPVTDGNLKIKGLYNAKRISGLSIRIYDFMGRMVVNKAFPESNKDVVNLNLNKLSNGIYFLSFYENEKLVVTRKIIVDSF